MLNFELRDIAADTPAQETESVVDRQEMNARLGELAARLTDRLNTLEFAEVLLGDEELDTEFSLVN